MRADEAMDDDRTDFGKRLRDSRGLLVFLAGVLALYLVFAGGAFIGRWTRLSDRPAPAAAAPAPEAAAPAPSSRPTEYMLVEAGSAATREQADALVVKLRRQYTSAMSELDPSDRTYRVYVGPYDAETARMVASELERQGLATGLRPYRRAGS